MATKTDLKYVDTSALIAFLDASDSYHALFAGLFAHERQLVTTPLVIAEGQGWFLRRFDIHRGLQFIQFIESLTILKIEPVTPKELNGAYSVLRQYSDQKLTLVDAMGIYMMKKLKVKWCWSTDRHLGLAGHKLIIHSAE